MDWVQGVWALNHEALNHTTLNHWDVITWSRIKACFNCLSKCRWLSVVLLNVTWLSVIKVIQEIAEVKPVIQWLSFIYYNCLTQNKQVFFFLSELIRKIKMMFIQYVLKTLLSQCIWLCSWFHLYDQELDGKLCKKTGQACVGTCAGDGHIGTSCENSLPKYLHIVNGRTQWFKPLTLSELYPLLKQYAGQRYRLVYGNTGFG